MALSTLPAPPDTDPRLARVAQFTRRACLYRVLSLSPGLDQGTAAWALTMALANADEARALLLELGPDDGDDEPVPDTERPDETEYDGTRGGWS